MGSSDRQGGHLIEGDNMLPAYSAKFEAELHDAGRLPHLRLEDGTTRLSPTIPAAPAQANFEDWEPDCIDELPSVDPG